MSMPTGHDPIDRLRAADPIRADDVPDASLARVSARVQEHIVSDHRSHPHPPADPRPARPVRRARHRRRRRARHRARVRPRRPGGRAERRPVAANPTPTENPAAGGGVASCLVYDPANLPTFDVVFDGTVTAIEGDQVTFDVNEGWKGAEGSVTLTAPQVDVALDRSAARLQGRWPLPRDRVGLDHQCVRLHARLRRRHGGGLGGGLRQLTRSHRHRCEAPPDGGASSNRQGANTQLGSAASASPHVLNQGHTKMPTQLWYRMA